MKKLTTIILGFVPFSLFAHGGHGLFDPHSLMHYLLSTEHALPVLILCAIGVVFSIAHYRNEKARTKS